MLIHTVRKYKMITVTQLNKASRKLIGMTVPQRLHGNVGNFVEEVLIAEGYEINKGIGPDLLSIGVEIKTRDVNSNAHHTIGTMTATSINSTEWEDSSICSKLQQQYRVLYDDKSGTIKSAGMYDFRHDQIQNELKKVYEDTRATIHSGLACSLPLSANVRCSSTSAYWELKAGTSYAFRISNSAMTKYEAIAKSGKSFSNLFV